jgi:hypothetical protein
MVNGRSVVRKVRASRRSFGEREVKEKSMKGRDVVEHCSRKRKKSRSFMR